MSRSEVLKLVGDYPFALIDESDRYMRVSPGWAQTYSPPQPPGWWVGKDHRKAFKLSEFPHWEQCYNAAKAGSPILQVEALDLPGLRRPSIQAWAINPDGYGGTFIVVLPMEDILKAAEIQAKTQRMEG